MNTDWKYVVIDEYWGGPTLIMFPPTLIHADMAASVKGEVLGAGFVTFASGKPVCYGRSESLKKDSRGELDTKLALRMFPS